MKSKEIFEQIEALIRQGRLVRARKLFRSLSLVKVRDERRLPLANFARRLDLLSIGLRLLGVQVFQRPPANPLQQQAIIAEYAVLLLQNGNIREAKDLLGRIGKVLHQDVYMAQAWCFFEFWEYEQSIPWLERYLSAQKEPYWHIAGRINLAEAHIAVGAPAEGLAILDSLIRDLKKDNHTRLVANALHLRARAYFFLGEIKKSDNEVRHAYRLFGDRVASDAILIRRQAAINRAFADGNESHLLKFRAEAVRAHAWESVRECDYQRLRLRFRPELFSHLYHGTPLPAYREYLERSFQMKRANEFYWGDKAGPEIDLRRRTFRARRMTQQNAALLGALLRDLYRPPSIGEIFSSIFPGERFDPATSPARAHQAIMRLRRWLIETRVPVRVRNIGSRYVLERSGPVRVLMQCETQLSISAVSLRCLSKGDGIVSVRDVQKWFGISKATATRRLSQAESQGQILKIGHGRATKYRIV